MCQDSDGTGGGPRGRGRGRNGGWGMGHDLNTLKPLGAEYAHLGVFLPSRGRPAGLHGRLSQLDARGLATALAACRGVSGWDGLRSSLRP